MRRTRMSPQRRPRIRTSTARRWGRRAAAAAAVAGIGIATAVLAPFASSQTPVPATIASRGGAAHTTYTSDSTTTLTVAAPAGAQAGDVLVASLGFGKTGAASQPTLTVPSGWTLVSRTNQGTVGTLAVFTHTFATGETSYSWTTNVTVGGSLFIAAFGNVNTTTPVDVAGGAPTATAATTLTGPTLTTTQAGDQLVAGYFGYDSAGTATSWAPPAGMTEIGDATNGASRSGELDTVAQAAAGATGQKTATASVKQDYGVAALTALAPKQTQAIGFTSTAPAPASVGGATYTPAASGGGSGNPVIFTIDPTASGVCAISAGVVSFTGAGTCVIDANQAGNGAYTAAPQTQQTFTVGGGTTPQTISFSSSAPVGATVGGTYTPVATATSGLGVAVTIDPAAASVCTISGGVVTFTGAGTCVVDANQAGNATYAPASQAQQSFGVGLTSQAIAFTSSAPAPASVGGATYTPAASGGGSGNPVIFSIDPTASGLCAISAGVVSFTGAGTCVIDANQAGNTAYSAAPQVQQSVAVVIGSTPQTISFVSSAPAGALVGGTYTPVATATSGLGVSITIDPSASTVCSATAGVVHFIGAGTCVVDADQAGNATYAAAPQAQQSFAVGLTAQTISFSSSAPVGATVGGTYTPVATATSGLGVAVTIDPAAASVCTISGGVVTFTGAGTCVVDANQAGNATYAPASQAQQSFGVAAPIGGGPATIASRGGAAHTTYTSDSTTTLTVAAPAGAQAGDVLVASLGFGKTGASSQPTLTAPAGWTLVSRTSHSTDGTLAVFTHTFATGETSYSWTTNVTVGGSLFIAAFGNVNTTTPIDVSGGVPTTTASATLATPSLTTTAAGDQLVAGYFAYDGGASGITWTPPAGMTEIGDATNGSSRSGELDTAAQAAAGATGQKTATASVKQDYGVAALTALAPKQTQAIGFTSTAPAPASVGGATYTPAASGGGSGNPVIFTIDPTASGVCAISAGVVSFTGAGTCVIDANQAGNGAYTAAPQTQQTFTVGGGTTPQTISFSSSAPVGATVGGTYTPVATATSGLGVAVTIDPAAASVCTISGGVVTFTGAGTCVVDANQAGNATYAPASQAQQSFGVGKLTLAAPTLALTPGPGALAITPFATVPNASSYSYQVCNQAGTSCGAAVAVTTSGATITGLVGGTTYQVDLTAVGNGTAYANSPPATQTGTPGPTVLATPVFTLTPSAGTLTINAFAAVTGATAYSYQRCDAAGANCGAATVVTTAGTAIGGLTDGTSYTLKLTAVGDGIVFANSAAAAVVGTAGAPSVSGTPLIVDTDM